MYGKKLDNFVQASDTDPHMWDLSNKIVVCSLNFLFFEFIAVSHWYYMNKADNISITDQPSR